MSTKNIDIQDFRPARKRADISVGESVSTIRKLQNLSLAQLSDLTNIPAPTLQAIERDELQLDIEQAKLIARALRVHPAVLAFPAWEVDEPMT